MNNYFKKKTIAFTTFLILFITNQSFSASGIFERYLIVENQSVSFHEGSLLNNMPLGSFTSNQTLILRGGQIKTFKNGPDDITGAAMFYRIYEQGSGQLPSYDTLYLPWKEDIQSPFGSIDQVWELSNHPQNILTGLANGTFVLEVYFEAYYTDMTTTGIHLDNNNGGNYTAIFTINDCILDLGSDMHFCSPFDIILSAPFGYNSYIWSNGDTDFFTSVNQAGTYSVTITHSQCTAVDTITITMGQSSYTLNLGNDTIICGHAGYIVNAGNGFESYIWSTGDTTASTIANCCGGVSVTVTTTDGCLLMDYINIEFKSLPLVDIGSNTFICSGDSLLLNAGQGFVSYQWSTNATTQEIYVKDAGFYVVTVTNNDGCSAFDAIQIDVLFAVSANFSYNLLGGTQIEFTNTSTQHTNSSWDYLGNGNFTQSTSNTTTFTYPQNGQYNVMLVAYNNCFSDTTQQLINIVSSIETSNKSFNDLLLYPNPSNGIINLKNLNHLFINKISIIDITGKHMKDITLQCNTDIEINLTDFVNGVYFLKIYAENSILNLKFALH